MTLGQSDAKPYRWSSLPAVLLVLLGAAVACRNEAGSRQTDAARPALDTTIVFSKPSTTRDTQSLPPVAASTEISASGPPTETATPPSRRVTGSTRQTAQHDKETSTETHVKPGAATTVIASPSGAAAQTSVPDDVVQRTPEVPRAPAPAPSLAGEAGGQQLSTANEAFRRGNCLQAVQLYQQVPRAADLNSPAGRSWIEGRLQQALCERRLKRYDAAIITDKSVLEAEAFQWQAKYDLAGTYCESGDYAKGAETYRSINGPYLNRIPQESKWAVEALARYGRGVCKYQELHNQAQPDNHPEMKDESLRLFSEFLFSAEGQSKDSLPAQIKDMLTKAIADSRAKSERLKT